MKTRTFKSLLLFGILVSIFSACSKEDDVVTYQLSSKRVELRCGKTMALTVTPALQGLKYTSLNTNIATVSADGLVTAKLVGSTNVVVKDSLNRFNDTVKVVVSTVNTVFSDPYLGFGANEFTVRDNVPYPLQQTMSLGEGYGYYLVFGAEDEGESMWLYRFDAQNKYISSQVFIPQMDYSELNKHLKDRYIELNGYSEEYYSDSIKYVDKYTYYINPDSTLVVSDIRYSANSGTWIQFIRATKELIQAILAL